MSRAGQGPVLETMTWLGALWSSATYIWSSMLQFTSHGPANDLDVLRTAGQLLGEHGEGAFAEAARLATHFAARRDVEKSHYWRRVMASLGEYRRAEGRSH